MKIVDVRPKIELRCQNGWSYLGYQKVQAHLFRRNDSLSLGVNVTKPLMELWNAIHIVGNLEALNEEELIQCCPDNKGDWWAFVLSGEGFTLQDFAEVIKNALPDWVEVDVIDGRPECRT